VDFAALAQRFIDFYNSKDFEQLAAMVAARLEFAHFNRNFAFSSRDELLAVLRQFAAALAPDRKFLPPERVTVAGNIVVREAWWDATAQVDLPGFADAGGKIHLRFCSVMRFDERGMLVEWRDYG
jgi:hypothetical protein